MNYRNMSWNILKLDKSLAAVTSKSNCSQFAFHNQPSSTGAGCVVKHCSRDCCSNKVTEVWVISERKIFHQVLSRCWRTRSEKKTIMDWAELPSSLRRYLMLWVVIRVAEQPPCSSKSGSKTWRALGISINHLQVHGLRVRFLRPSKLLLSRERSKQQEQVSAATYGSACTSWHPAQTNRSLAVCQVPLQEDRERHLAEDSAASLEYVGEENEVTEIFGTTNHPEANKSGCSCLFAM